LPEPPIPAYKLGAARRSRDGLPRPRRGAIHNNNPSIQPHRTTMPDIAEALLSVRGVTVRFGGIVALDGVSFDVARGDVCGLIGPNGAGKTTLFNCLSRLYDYQAGDILFEGRSITPMASHQVAGLGMGRTFQNLAMFRTLPVRDNVMVGAHSRSAAGFVASALRLPSVGTEERRLRRRADEIMDYLALTDVAQRLVGDLPFATQKRVELGRALAADPKLLLLDEPAAGLNHEELEDLARLIKDIRDRLGMTVLLVEHHMSLVMSVSDHIVALNFGRRIAEGSPAEIQNHPEVIEAYLGAPADA
jgi:branched-chain amino acid transport system ATP-binding protein